MEKPYTGLTAVLKTGAENAETIALETLGYVSGVDLTNETDIIEILALGNTYKEKVPSIKDWSASISGTVALAKGESQASLYNAFNSGTAITVGIYLNETTYFEGQAYVKNFNISIASDSAITLKCDISGTGAVTLTMPTV